MKYVLVYPQRAPRRGEEPLLLIRKAKPEWQKGRLNLVGGKVEPGETYEDAAVREFKEETNLPAWGFRQVGTISSARSDFSIGVFACYTDPLAKITSEPGEPVAWFDWHLVKNDRALMENLKIVCPLIQAGVHGWAVIHEDKRVYLDMENSYGSSPHLQSVA